MRYLAIALVAAALAACGDAPPPPSQKTVIDTQIKALEKAKAIEEKVENHAAEAAKKIEDAGG